MTTIAVGQLVEQINTHGRVWRIERQLDDVNWQIRLTTDGEIPHSSRMVGELSQCTTTWLQERCRDWVPPRIEPPCGDGAQTIRALCNGEPYVTERFDTSAEVVAYVGEFLAGTDNCDDDLRIEWYGWDAADAVFDWAPDMTATCVDGEVVWAEV